jgi:hypothetical protein
MTLLLDLPPTYAKGRKRRMIDLLRKAFPHVFWTYRRGIGHRWEGSDVRHEYEVYFESTIIDAEHEVFGSQLRFMKYERKAVENKLLSFDAVTGEAHLR